MSDETGVKKDFFISYATEDEAWAEWIAWELEENGHTTYLQAWDFGAGANFVLKMNAGTKDCERTIALLSPKYLESDFAKPEWAAAFRRDPTGEKGLFLPLRIAECEPEGLLPQIIYTDLVDLSETEMRERLLKKVRRERGKPASKPSFPKEIKKERPQSYPGIPSVWNVPRRNPNFTGRDAYLEALKGNLAAGKATALTTHAIKGMGGAGKTQLAREYAHRNKADYDVVWWVRSEQATERSSDLAELALELNPELDPQADIPTLVGEAKGWLERNGGWLLVFDNVEHPEDLKGVLPEAGQGHVIITSRHGAWGGIARAVLVEVMEPGEAANLLLKRSGSDDGIAAAALAKELGYLPLALAQAAAYAESTGMGLAEYRELFDSRYLELWEKAGAPEDYPETVGTTWSLSIEKLENENPEALDLLRLCAFFAPEEIPREMLTATGADLPGGLNEAFVDPILFNECRRAIGHFSLADVTPTGITLHRLVQAIIRDHLDEDRVERFLTAAVGLFLDAVPDDLQTNVAAWPKLEQVLSHALACAGHTEKLGLIPEETSTVLTKLGMYLHIRADFGAARDCFERAINIVAENLGPNHPNLGAGVNNLGRALHDMGDLDGAKQCFERALKFAEERHGPEHPFVATGANNLGTVLREMGDTSGAERCYERALEIAERHFGSEHPDVANKLGNFGVLLKDKGELDRAIQYYERALKIDENHFGREHPSYAVRVSNLGGLLLEQGNLEGAEECAERALRIQERVFGSDHPATQKSRENLRRVRGFIVEKRGN